MNVGDPTKRGTNCHDDVAVSENDSVILIKAKSFCGRLFVPEIIFFLIGYVERSEFCYIVKRIP